MLYYLSMAMFIGFLSPLNLWMFLEVNMTIFICLLISFQNFFNLVLNQTLYYFIIQSVASICILFVFTWFEFPFFSSGLAVILMLKLGLAPFHFWVFYLVKYLNGTSCLYLLVMQKIPILLYIMSLEFSVISYFVFFNMVVSSYFLLIITDFSKFMVCSSICSFSWFFLLSMISYFSLVLFFFKYSIMTSFLTSMKNIIQLYVHNFFSHLKIMSMVIFFSGLPPMAYFFFKFYFVSMFNYYSSFMFFLLFWVFSFMCLVGYTKFLLFFVSHSGLMFLMKNQNYNMSYMVIMTIFSFYSLSFF